MKKLIYIVLVFLLFYTRFVNLSWGLPYPMHPDERNMAVAVQQLSCIPYNLQPTTYNLRECFNPHFFAYGQLPLYLSYGGIHLYHLLTGQIGQPSFLEATLALRALSALSSLLLVFVLLKIIELLNQKKGLYKLYNFTNFTTLAFFIFQPYAIQFAHFGTTESLLMLFYALIVYFSLRFETGHRPVSTVIILGILSGLSLGTKTSSILFLGVPILVILIKGIYKSYAIGGTSKGGVRTMGYGTNNGICRKIIKVISSFIHLFIYLFLYFFICMAFFLLSSPQSFLNWTDFMSSMQYESAVGLGTYVPFYTRQFVGSTPILFPFQQILPYVLGLPQLVLSILGFILLPSFIGQMIKRKIIYIFQVAKLKGPVTRAQSARQQAWQLWSTDGKQSILTESEKLKQIQFDILRFSLLLSFLPPSLFFAKWTRFIAPSFPLFSLFAILFLLQYAKKYIKVITVIIVITVIPGIAFLSIYLSPDVRFTASDWIYKNIPANSKILTETANVIDLPVPTTYNLQPTRLASESFAGRPTTYQINSFNFYDLDANPQLQIDLSEALKQADYIVVPSRRIFANHTCLSPQSAVNSQQQNSDQRCISLTTNPSASSGQAYPLLNKYYSDLFSGSLGFEQVAEFSSYPQIKFQVLSYKFQIPFPDENAEETWTVFDHPVIRIYKRSQQSTAGSQQLKTQNNLDFSNYKTTNYALRTTNYELLVADSPSKWERGLMYVQNKKDIGGLDGMMFQFPDSQVRRFWNKNTLSHLTLYWINKGKVIGVSDLPSITETKEVSTVSSPNNTDTVVELLR